MPTCIVHLDGFYMEWSTVADAPLHPGLPLEAFRAYYKEQYGVTALPSLVPRLKRADQYGSSMYSGYDPTPGNRAGPREETLTRAQLIATFCHSDDAREFQKLYETNRHESE